MRYRRIRHYAHDRFSLGRDSLTGEAVFAIAVPLYVGHYTAYYRLSEEELARFLADEPEAAAFAVRIEHGLAEERHMTAALSTDLKDGSPGELVMHEEGFPWLSLEAETILHLAKKAPRYTLHRDGRSGQAIFTIPVSNRMADYEEYYRINEAELALLLAHPKIAAAFAECCGHRQMDDRLVLKPGTDRGFYSG